MLAPPDPKKDKARKKDAAHKRRKRRRKKLGLVSLSGEGDQVAAETLLEGHGLLPCSTTEHSYADIQKAWQRYLDIVLARSI